MAGIPGGRRGSDGSDGIRGPGIEMVGEVVLVCVLSRTWTGDFPQARRSSRVSARRAAWGAARGGAGTSDCGCSGFQTPVEAVEVMEAKEGGDGGGGGGRISLGREAPPRPCFTASPPLLAFLPGHSSYTTFEYEMLGHARDTYVTNGPPDISRRRYFFSR
ncbi:Protein of unknown function [Gryllus bimaculatus]|nr:Protein of unknown function [Gryllus bimaculatus]